MLWTMKYKPKLVDIPQDTKPLADFVANFKKAKKRALLVHGPAGTGKTAAVYALASQLNVELIEVNASDFRTAAEINSKIGNALKNQSLFFAGKLILVDELDGIAGSEDRGGIGALAELIEHAAFPVILIANDAWEQKLNSIRSKCVLVEFPKVSVSAMLPLLSRILVQEKISADELVLKALARRSGGDVRGAIIDLQMLVGLGVTMQELEKIDERQQSESIKEALVKIFKSTDVQVARSALDVVDTDVDESMLWIDENLPKEYTLPADVARAYEALSRADVFKGRIRKLQYWRYLAYVIVLMTAGVAVAKDKKSSQVVEYVRTQRILKLWMAKQKYARRKRVAEKLASATHCSRKKALQESLPFVHQLFQKKHPSAELIGQELKLDEEELEWLNK